MPRAGIQPRSRKAAPRPPLSRERIEAAAIDLIERESYESFSIRKLAAIDGQYSGLLLRGEVARAREESPGVPWRYSSLDAARRLRIPQLWVFAEDDDVAPAAPSIARLQRIGSRAGRIKVAVYPGTTHGIRVIRRDGDGRRRETGDVAPGYAKLLADFAKGTLARDYGEARWVL